MGEMGWTLIEFLVGVSINQIFKLFRNHFQGDDCGVTVILKVSSGHIFLIIGLETVFSYTKGLSTS